MYTKYSIVGAEDGKEAATKLATFLDEENEPTAAKKKRSRQIA
jgi:hypothetical protein